MPLKTLTVAVSILLCVNAFGADLFYEQRLKTGQSALAAKQYVDAAQELRIAVFGLLDEPKRLTEALALLAVAQAGVGRSDDVQQTIERFIDIETRFKAYDRDALDPAHRAQFESLILRTVPKQTLAGVPSLAPLLQPVAQTKPAREATRPAAREPQPRNPAPRNPAPAPVTAAPVKTSRETMAEATKLVSTRKFAEAVSILSEAVGRDGSNRELRLMLMQSAALAKNWPVAAAQVPLVSPFPDSESVPMFYAAISLYETGRLTDAREILNRALPRLTKSPFVEEYATRIIGPRSGS